MPEEVKDVQDQANADQAAPEGDIDLDSAAADAERRLAGGPAVSVEEKTDVVEEKVEEKPEGEKKDEAAVPTPDEPHVDPEDHKERTKLGRKVAKLEDTIGKLLEQNQALIQKLVIPQAQVPEPEQECVDLSTPEGLDRFLSQREQQRNMAAQRDKIEYSAGYATQLGEWNSKLVEDADPDVTEINKLLTTDTPFNVRHSANPKADFEYNLSRAEAHYYKQKAKTSKTEKKAPLQNSTPRSPLAVGGESKVDSSTSVKPVKMSAAAMEFAKAQGWGDKEVAEILSSPIQNSFVKGRR